MGRGQAPAAAISMTLMQRKLLEEIALKHSTPQQKAKRANILILANQGYSNAHIKREIGTSLNTVKEWRKRWLSTSEELTKYENYFNQGQFSLLDYRKRVIELLTNQTRSGAPKTITLSQEQQIIALACEEPVDHQIEMTDWTHEMLAHVAVAKGIVASISSRQVGRILKKKSTSTA